MQSTNCLQMASTARQFAEEMADCQPIADFLERVRTCQESIGLSYVTAHDIKRFRSQLISSDKHSRYDARQKLQDYLHGLADQLVEQAKIRGELPSWWRTECWATAPDSTICGIGDIAHAAKICIELIQNSKRSDEVDESILNLRRCCFEWLPSGHSALDLMDADVWSDETPDQWELRVLRVIRNLEPDDLVTVKEFANGYHIDLGTIRNAVSEAKRIGTLKDRGRQGSEFVFLRADMNNLAETKDWTPKKQH